MKGLGIQLFLGAAVAISSLTACRAHFPELPPLLRKLPAGGDSQGACPSANERVRQIEERGRANAQASVSQEFPRRLTEAFPPGSGEDRLVAELMTMGFQVLAPCQTDSSIRTAQFDEKPSGVSFPLLAIVYWKVDDHKRVIWTRGSIFYTGP